MLWDPSISGKKISAAFKEAIIDGPIEWLKPIIQLIS